MSWTRLLLVESQTNILFPNKMDGICKSQQNVQVLCEILLGSLCNRMPQIFPTPRIPSKMLVKGCQVLPSVLFGPKFGVLLWGSGFLGQFPSSSQQRFLNTTTFRRDFIHFHFCQKLTLPTTSAKWMPPNLPGPRLDGATWIFFDVQGRWHLSLEVERRLADRSGESFGNPSFDLWIPMAMGGGLRSIYNNISSMKDEWLFVCFSHGLTYEEGESSYKIWRFREILWFDVFS